MLELAAGVGDPGLFAAKRLGPDGRLLSSDLSPEMLAAARRRATELQIENVEFRILDTTAIDLPTSSVDGVLCRFGIMLVDDPALAVGEIRRVLRPGGRAAIAVWASADANPWMSAAGRSAVALGLMERPDPRAPGPFRLSDANELRRLVVNAGLRVVELEEVPVRWRAKSADRWWEAVRDSSRRLAVLLEQLSPEQTAAVRRGAEERLAGFVAEDGSLDVPGLARALLAIRDA